MHEPAIAGNDAVPISIYTIGSMQSIKCPVASACIVFEGPNMALPWLLGFTLSRHAPYFTYMK